MRLSDEERTEIILVKLESAGKFIDDAYRLLEHNL